MVQAFLIGATGEVGKQVLKGLAESGDYSKIVVFARRIIDYEGPNSTSLHWEIVPNFDDLESHSAALRGCTVGFCTLGSTKAKAGSAEAFQHIDYDYTMTIAKMAKEAGCKWFGVVTSVGANANSSFLYPRVKGLIERDLIGLEFNCLEIFRPGFLLCDRQERRPLESIGLTFAKGFNWCFPNVIAITTETVAQAMIKEAKRWQEQQNSETKFCIHENKAIAQLAE